MGKIENEALQEVVDALKKVCKKNPWLKVTDVYGLTSDPSCVCIEIKDTVKDEEYQIKVCDLGVATDGDITDHFRFQVYHAGKPIEYNTVSGTTLVKSVKVLLTSVIREYSKKSVDIG